MFAKLKELLKGEPGPRGIQGEKGDVGPKGEKGDNCSCNCQELFSAIVPEANGVRLIMNQQFKEEDLNKYSSAYSSNTHFDNELFNQYGDLTSRDEIFSHLKLVVIDLKDGYITYIPEYEIYKEIFTGFRQVPGMFNKGIDISLTLTVIKKLIKLLPVASSVGYSFNLYFFPNNKQVIKSKFTKIELLEGKLETLSRKVSIMEDEIFQLMREKRF